MTEETPRLIGVVIAPEYVCSALADDDGGVEFHPIALISYSDSPHSDKLNRWMRQDHKDWEFIPHTNAWVSDSISGGMWRKWDQHYNRRRSGACTCGHPDCRIVGTGSTRIGAFRDNSRDAAQERAKYLAKVQKRREKQREYSRRRKTA